jgi:hypothetical protein
MDVVEMSDYTLGLSRYKGLMLRSWYIFCCQ